MKELCEENIDCIIINLFKTAIFLFIVPLLFGTWAHICVIFPHTKKLQEKRYIWIGNPHARARARPQQFVGSITE